MAAAKTSHDQLKMVDCILTELPHEKNIQCFLKRKEDRNSIDDTIVWPVMIWYCMVWMMLLMSMEINLGEDGDDAFVLRNRAISR